MDPDKIGVQHDGTNLQVDTTLWVTCWCSVGNDLPGFGNEPGDPLKETIREVFLFFA